MSSNPSEDGGVVYGRRGIGWRCLGVEANYHGKQRGRG